MLEIKQSNFDHAKISEIYFDKNIYYSKQQNVIEKLKFDLKKLELKYFEIIEQK